MNVAPAWVSPLTRARNKSKFSAGSRLAGLSGLQAMSGAVSWTVALAVLDDEQLGAFGSMAAVIGLSVLIGGAGLPVVVYRFSAPDMAGSVRRVVVTSAIIGGAISCMAALALGAVRGPTGALIVAAALSPWACAAVVGDALLVTRGEWTSAGRRITMAMVLRVGLVAAAAAGGGLWAAVAAGVVPDAVTASWALRRSRPVASVGGSALPVGFATFVGSQYLSAVMVFGPVLLVPVIAAPTMSTSDLAMLLPAWAAISMAYSAVHAAANGRLLQDAAPTGRWSQVVPRSALLATAALGLGAGGIVLVSVAYSRVGADRLAGVAAATSLLLASMMGWPVVAGWLAEARRRLRNVAAIAMVVPLAIVPPVLALQGDGLTVGLVAGVWAAAIVGCLVVGALVKPWVGGR